MKKNFKGILVLVIFALLIGTFAGCASGGKSFDVSNEITVVSREEGSGARGAFVELLKIEVKNADGTKKDRTTSDAIIANKADVVLSQVAGNMYSIGYISSGSLNDSIKAVQVDGVEVSPENVKNGTYKVARPFIIATNGEATGLKKDFIDFATSKQGQEIVYNNKYVKINDNAPEYKSSNLSGKLVIAGSSSVTPIMEKIKEGYAKLNPNINVEVQLSDSTAGIKAAQSNICDIAMSSRTLKDTEKLIPVTFAIDGMAVIVHKDSTITNISSADITKIFIGEIKQWDEISK
jgi:phosphate transport system substrate-binding protein